MCFIEIHNGRSDLWKSFRYQTRSVFWYDVRIKIHQNNSYTCVIFELG